MIGEEKMTLCDHEDYQVKCNNIKHSEETVTPLPLIMGFLISKSIRIIRQLCQIQKSRKIVFFRYRVYCPDGDPVSKYKKYLLTLGEPDQTSTEEDVTILRYKSEGSLIDGFAHFIQNTIRISYLGTIFYLSIFHT